MREVTVTGRTVDEAIEKALTELKVPRDHIKVTVIEEAKKGFLGIGSKPAIVQINEILDPVETARTYLQTVIEKMGIDAEIKKKEHNDDVLFELVSDKVAILIGKRGQTLNALQHLTNLVANRHTHRYIRIYLDAENYRKRREETLKQLAKRQAEKALKRKEKVVLDPMPAQERRIVHLELKNRKDIFTESEGEGTHRHVVIIPSYYSNES